MNTENSLHSCSDKELITQMTQIGYEKSVVLDGEGGLVNRPEVIGMLTLSDSVDKTFQEKKDQSKEEPRKIWAVRCKDCGKIQALSLEEGKNGRPPAFLRDAERLNKQKASILDPSVKFEDLKVWCSCKQVHPA